MNDPSGADGAPLLTDRVEVPDGARLVLATHNAGKLAELRQILTPLVPGLVPESVISAASLQAPEPVEDGLSFADNALLKARALARATGLPAVADDSGLCVDVLGGAPGIFSARWSGRHGDDTANLNLLLRQLSDIADEHRSAKFCCAASLAVPEADGGYEAVEYGELPGVLLHAPQGDGGFGYDPILQPTELNGDNALYGGDYAGQSCAQIPAEIKNSISHRARAFAALVPHLEKALTHKTV